MASLTDWATAVRAEAERARIHSVSLRQRIHRQVEASERRRLQLQATMTLIDERRYGQFRTAWSDLLWRRPTRNDEHVLELVDR